MMNTGTSIKASMWGEDKILSINMLCYEISLGNTCHQVHVLFEILLYYLKLKPKLD